MGDKIGATNRLIPILVLAVGVMCISTGSIFARLADAPALVKSAYRVGIASLVFIPAALAYHRDEFRRLTRRDVCVTMLSGMFLSLHFAAWISSLDYTTVASSVILCNTIPIWIAVVNIALGRGRPGRTMWISILLSVTGACIVGYGDMSFDRNALFGDALALVGAIGGAVYIMCGAESRKKLSLTAYAALCYGFSAVVLFCAVLLAGCPLTGYAPSTWGAFAGLALMSQVLGHSSYNWALGYFSAGFIAIMLLGEPLGSSILAFLLFREMPTAMKLAGCAILMASIVLAARSEQK
ncbi:MAG: DMT family transporter [Synergistaceae bacterium]|jgi:drug/metabolite transporter (DMT)-like permease|nr:DMT family transporter [Synergistaceae bacterium]